MHRSGPVLAAILALLVAGCGGNGAKGSFRSVKVGRGPIEVTIAAAGPIQPLKAVEVKSRASGEVLTIPYDAGQAVSAGTTLAVIDPREERERFRLSEADLISARARLAQARSRWELDRDKLASEIERAEAAGEKAKAELARASADFRRQKELHKKGLASRQTLESVTSQRDTAAANQAQADAELVLARFRRREVAILQEDVTLAEAGVLRAEVAFEEAKKRLDDTVIRAPMDGLLLERKVEQGQIIASGISNVGGGTTLMTLADASRLFVRASVDESDVGQMAEGQAAVVVVDSFPDQKFRGEVTWISPLGIEEQDVTSFEVLVEVFEDDFEGLRCGMTATCQFVAARVDEALHVPPPALRQRKGRYFVDVVTDSETGEAHPLEVTPGLRGADRIEVRGEGLSQGLEVLLTKFTKKARTGEGERKSDPLWFLKKKKKPGQGRRR